MANKKKPASSKDRTQEDILDGLAFEVNLGGKIYQVKELNIEQDVAFRRELGNLLGQFLNPLATHRQSEWLSAILPNLFAEGYDQVKELIFNYDRSLPRDEIMAKATSEELFEAGLEVLKLSVPLVQKILEGLMKLAPQMGVNLGNLPSGSSGQ